MRDHKQLVREDHSQLGHLSRRCHQVDPRFLLSVALTSHTPTAWRRHDPPPPSLLQRYPEGSRGSHAHRHPQGEFKTVKLRLRSGTALADQPLPHSCCPALPDSPGLPCPGPASVGGAARLVPWQLLQGRPREPVCCLPTSRRISSLCWARNRTFKTQNSRKLPKRFWGCRVRGGNRTDPSLGATLPSVQPGRTLSSKSGKAPLPSSPSKVHILDIYVHEVTSVMSDSVTLCTVACHAPLSMGLSRQEYWSGLPCPAPGDLPEPEIELTSLMSSALAGGFLTTSATWEAPWTLNASFL